MTYEQDVIQILNRYKRKHSSDMLTLIPVLNDVKNTIGFLHPITTDFRTTILPCVELLSRWRAENPTLSPTRFTITHAGTEKWISDLIINNNQRILFMVQDLNGTYIGHMGFACFRYEQRAASVDLVVRGEKTASRGLMSCAIRALVNWGKAELKLEHIDLDVLWDNEHAISFYKRCGFQEKGLVPLKRVQTAEELRWIPCNDPLYTAEKYYLHMILC